MTTPASLRFCQVLWGSRGTCTIYHTPLALPGVCALKAGLLWLVFHCHHTSCSRGEGYCPCLCAGTFFPQQAVFFTCVNLEGSNAFEGYLVTLLLPCRGCGTCLEGTLQISTLSGKHTGPQDAGIQMCPLMVFEQHQKPLWRA